MVKLGDGNDTVTVVDLKLSKRGSGVTFTGGNGNNSLFFDGLNINIDTLKATSGSGNFTFAPSNTVRQSFGSIDINCPNSTCDILLGGMGVARTTHVVTGANQADKIQIDNAIFVGKVTLLTGGGSDQITMGQLSPNDQIELTFASALVIDMGAGSDSLSAGMPWHGPTDPLPKPDFVHFNGTVSFDGGDGSDTIDVWHPRSTDFSLEGNPVCDNWETIVYAP